MQPLQAIMAPTNRRLTNVVIATMTSVSPENRKRRVICVEISPSNIILTSQSDGKKIGTIFIKWMLFEATQKG